jgi:glycosyltransferase involved in cell wall biosynthesis
MSEREGPIRVALDAHVVGRHKGGNETYVLALADGLAARPDVDVVAYVDRGMSWPGGPPVGLSTRLLVSRRPHARIPFELPFRAARDRADVLHVQYVAPPLIRTPVVTAIHDVSFDDVPEYFGAATRVRLRAFVRLATRRSAAVVTPSAFTRERLLHHFDVDPARVFVTPLALPGRAEAPDSDDAQARLAHLGLRGPFVLHVGRLDVRKNVARLVQAVAAARRGGAELGLVLAGSSGRRVADVEGAVASTGAGAWVLRLGHVDDGTLAALYRLARVVAYPSLYEGFGLPVLEGMAAGVPVVASAGSAIAEVAADAALLVDPTDVSAICEAILKAACDEETRARLSAAGPRRAAGFTVARLADTTVAAYRYALRR